MWPPVRWDMIPDFQSTYDTDTYDQDGPSWPARGRSQFYGKERAGCRAVGDARERGRKARDYLSAVKNGRKRTPSTAWPRPFPDDDVRYKHQAASRTEVTVCHLPGTQFRAVRREINKSSKYKCNTAISEIGNVITTFHASHHLETIILTSSRNDLLRRFLTAIN